MSKTYNYYLTVTMKDLVSAIMVNEDRTEIRTGEVYDLYLDTMAKMKQKGIYGGVQYSREYLKEFKQEYEEEFEVGIGYIRLRDKYNMDWLQEHIVSYMSLIKLELLGLIEQNNTYTL